MESQTVRITKVKNNAWKQLTVQHANEQTEVN